MAIVVIGNVFVDIKGFPLDKYIPDGRNAGRVEIVHGGVGRNVAEDIANMELRPRFVSMVDESAIGADVVRRLKNHKADTDYVLVRPGGMGMWLAVFSHTGNVSGSISSRPDMKPIAELLEEKGDEVIAGADSIVIEIDMDKDVLKQVFRLSKKHGIPVYAVVANMSIASKRRDFLKSTSCFTCNLEEAGILFVRDFSGMSPEQFAPELSSLVISAGFNSMVVTMGGEGCVYADSEGHFGTVPSMKVAVRDTTGAGDAFCAGLSAGLTYGKTLEEACRIGTRLAASAITVSENVCPRFMPGELGLDYKAD